MFTKPLLIVAAVALVLIGVLGWLLKESYAANGALEVKLVNAQAIIDQRELDAKENAIAVARLAKKLNDTETKVITVTERIYAAPVTRECGKSPAIRAALDGVQLLYQQPATVQTGGGAQPPSPLSRPDPGPGGSQR